MSDSGSSCKLGVLFALSSRWISDECSEVLPEVCLMAALRKEGFLLLFGVSEVFLG